MPTTAAGYEHAGSHGSMEEEDECNDGSRSLILYEETSLALEIIRAFGLAPYESRAQVSRPSIQTSRRPCLQNYNSKIFSSFNWQPTYTLFIMAVNTYISLKNLVNFESLDNDELVFKLVGIGTYRTKISPNKGAR